MGTRSELLGKAVRESLDVVVIIPVLVVLHRYGYAGHAPLWLLVVLLVLSGVNEQPALQRWVAGGGSVWRLNLIMATSCGLRACFGISSGGCGAGQAP